MKEDVKMFKRLLVGMMCVGFMALLATAANAGWPTYAGGWVGWSSVDCNSLWRGFGNTDNNPVEIACTILPLKVEAQCMNPAGNIGGGVVFDLYGPIIAASEIIEPVSLDARGKVWSEIMIYDQEIYDGLDLGLSDVCDEFNNGTSTWMVAPPPEGYVRVHEMYVQFNAWVEGITEPVEEVQLACEIDDINDPAKLYDCILLCDMTKKGSCEPLSSYNVDFSTF
jgi:hypothetical protein